MNAHFFASFWNGWWLGLWIMSLMIHLCRFNPAFLYRSYSMCEAVDSTGESPENNSEHNDWHEMLFTSILFFRLPVWEASISIALAVNVILWMARQGLLQSNSKINHEIDKTQTKPIFWNEESALARRWSDLKLHPNLERNLVACNYPCPINAQEYALKPLMAHLNGFEGVRQDARIKSLTGTGKTLTFLVPIINR